MEVKRPLQGPGSRRESILLKSASLRGRQVWGSRSERQAGDVTPKMALTDEFTCGQRETSLPVRETVRAKGSDPGRVQEFQVPGPGGGAFDGKELAPRSGSKGLLPSQTRRRQKFALHSQENVMQEFRRTGQEESGVEPHSSCPAGRR